MSLSEEFDPLAELELFMDDLPTVRCGEGGCDSCDKAFRSCIDSGVKYTRDTTPVQATLDSPDWDELGERDEREERPH
jgi:hypothetical protein